jgi:hypothetical protein
MALEAAFADLCAHCRTLHEALIALRTTTIEDKPAQGDVVLVDTFGNAAEDLLGWLEEMLSSASEGRQAVGHPLDMNLVRRALTTCQGRFNRMTHRFSTDLASYERVEELVSFGREHSGEWRTWTNDVKEALDRCQQPFFDLNQALFRCWQEITECVGLTSVSIQTTNIGQKITVPEGTKVSGDDIT